MKIKFKHILAVLFVFAFFSATWAQLEKAKEELLETDKAFEAYSFEHGISEAFVNFADESAIMLINKGDIVRGKTSIAEFLKKDNGSLTWQPEFADASLSGDLGYTWGYSKYVIKDILGKEEIYYSKYTTVWKKQSDGSWKFVLDMGNSGPNRSE